MNSKRKTILMTGSSGFIGKNLFHKLEKRFNVVCLVREKTQHKKSHENQILLSEIEEFFANKDLYAIFHLGAYFTAEKFPDVEEIKDLVASNIKFTALLGKSLSKLRPVKIIYTESMAQYAIKNSYPNFYALTKATGASILEYFLPNNTYLVTIALPDTYGPNDKRPKLFKYLKDNIETKSTIELSGGDQILTYLHVEDVTDGLIHALEKLTLRNKISKFRLDSDEELTLKRLILEFEKVLGQKIEANWGVKPYKPSDVFTKLDYPEKLPNWTSKIKIQDGLKTIL